MATTLRDLLIQRAARLQERPALTASDWGTLSYAQLRNRVEGVALGLLATESPPAVVFSATGTPWDWVAELAAAASGLIWDAAGWTVPAAILGGPSFNHEAGRGPYHAREQAVTASTPFMPDLNHGDLLARLRRLNVQLGWDHTTELHLPQARLGEAPVRGALWSALYAGAHVVVGAEPEQRGSLTHGRTVTQPAWNPEPFAAFWASSWTI